MPIDITTLKAILTIMIPFTAVGLLFALLRPCDVRARHKPVQEEL